ncbi:efflux transporter outer membrane subunit [Phaeospirillum tilakii]|uniref:Efflux transporter outer membrane subunit n=1 Tax=Phaeospirillum tilakii TaxID=741673 RepID=A0ABW5CDR0_9PROT
MLVALLSACSIGDPYQRPETPTPAAWSAAERAAVWPAPDWWRGFGSPQLDRLMAQASADNFDLAVAVAKLRAAQAQLRVAGASLWPELTADASGTRQRASMTASPSATARKPVYSSSYSATLGASYELDFWGKNQAGVESAQALLDASGFDYQTAVLSMQASVASTYFDILGTQERLRLARESLANAEAVLAVYRDRFTAGTATSLDVAQQESVVATQRATVPPLEQSLQQSRNALAILVGQLPEALDLAPETIDAVRVPAVGPGLPSELLARRPDVLSAEANLRGANADVTVARAAWFPSISLTGQAGFQSVDLAKMMTHQSLLASIGPSLTVPLFDGGKIAGTVEQKKAIREQLVQTYRKTVYSAFSDVENALVGLQKTSEEEQAEIAAEATARRAFTLTQDLMSGGTVDISSVLNTQKTWFTAQDALAQARAARLKAAVTLFNALGGGWSGKNQE